MNPRHRDRVAFVRIVSGRCYRGLDATIIGASNHVGRPMVLELLLAGATTTCCHRFTKDLQAHVGREVAAQCEDRVPTKHNARDDR